MKALWVRLVRLLRGPLEALGVLRALEARRERRLLLWLRSLFAIHDIDDLVALDLPWWSLRAVERVDAFLAARPDARVFEYGSGASTLWLARRASSVVSVEHDTRWAPVVERFVSARPNVDYRVAPAPTIPVGSAVDARYTSEKEGWRGRSFEDYVKVIEDVGGVFDLVVVDGRARVACFEAAQRHLAPGGMIVFDNSGRGRYRRAIESAALDRERLRGLTACLPYPDETTLLRRPTD